MDRAERRRLKQLLILAALRQYNWEHRPAFRFNHEDWMRFDPKEHFKWQGRFNPPSGYRRMWRKLARARYRRMMQGDLEELVLPPSNRITSIYDWY